MTELVETDHSWYLLELKGKRQFSYNGILVVIEPEEVDAEVSND